MSLTNLARTYGNLNDPYRLYRARISIFDGSTLRRADLLDPAGADLGITAYADIMQGWRSGCRYTHAGGAEYLCRVDQTHLLNGPSEPTQINLVPVSYLTGGSPIIGGRLNGTTQLRLCSGTTHTNNATLTELQTTVGGVAQNDRLDRLDDFRAIDSGGSRAQVSAGAFRLRASDFAQATSSTTLFVPSWVDEPTTRTTRLTATVDRQGTSSSLTHTARSIDPGEPFEFRISGVHSTIFGSDDRGMTVSVHVLCRMVSAGLYFFEYSGLNPQVSWLSGAINLPNAIIHGSTTGTSVTINFTFPGTACTLVITPTASSSPQVRTTGATVVATLGIWSSLMIGGA